jgi:hypothetical protein
VGCKLDFASETIFGAKSYTKSLEVDVSVDGSYSGVVEASFSASTDYKEVHEGSSKSN